MQSQQNLLKTINQPNIFFIEMQKQALKGLFFNISTCFSPLLSVFLTRENSLMFSAYLPIRTISFAARTKLRPAPQPLVYIIRYTLSAQSPLSLCPTIAFQFDSKRSNSFQFFPILSKLERIGAFWQWSYCRACPFFAVQNKAFRWGCPCSTAEIAKFREFQ